MSRNGKRCFGSGCSRPNRLLAGFQYRTGTVWVFLRRLLNLHRWFRRWLVFPDWSSCKTPVNELGSCVLVAECNFIRQVLQKPILGQNDIRFIEASRCGIKDKKALVCCAKPSGSPPAGSSPPVTQPVTSRIDQADSNVDKRSLLPKSPVCGVQYSDRIVGGERTKIDEYPWTARVQHFDNRC